MDKARIIALLEVLAQSDDWRKYKPELLEAARIVSEYSGEISNDS